MLLALVLMAQVTTTPQNPCSDQLSELCRISPLFCPSAYPDGLVPGTNGIPCWPGRQVAPVGRSGSLERTTIAVGRTTGAQAGAAVAAQAARATSTRERLVKFLEDLRRNFGLSGSERGVSSEPRD